MTCFDSVTGRRPAAGGNRTDELSPSFRLRHTHIPRTGTSYPRPLLSARLAYAGAAAVSLPPTATNHVNVSCRPTEDASLRKLRPALQRLAN